MNLFTNIYYLLFTFFEFVLLFELVFISLYEDINKKNIGGKLLINMSFYITFILYNISLGFIGGIVVPIILILLHIIYFIYYLLRKRRMTFYNYNPNAFRPTTMRFNLDNRSDISDDYSDKQFSPTLSLDDVYDSPEELEF